MAKIPSNFGNSLGATAGTGSPIMSGGYQVPLGGSMNGNVNDLFNKLFPVYSGTPAQIPFASAPVSGPSAPMQGTPAMVPTTGAGAGSQVPLQRYSAYNAARSY